MKVFRRIVALAAAALFLISVPVLAVSMTDVDERDFPKSGYDYTVRAEFSKGNAVAFGSYPQSSADEKEPIVWIVASEKDGTAMLIARNCLSSMPYRYERIKGGWADSDVRKWLNNEFLNEAFSEEERAKLVSYNTGAEGGDLVFLPSSQEVRKDLPEEVRFGLPTKYALEQGAVIRRNGICWWWLRDNASSHAVKFMDVYGHVAENGTPVDSVSFGIRPAILVKTEG